MKRIFTIVLLHVSFLAGAQGDFKLLKKELATFARNDTVIVFGTFCAECSGVSQSKYFISTKDQSKLFIANDQSGKSEKIFDSTFRCKECTTIVEYAKHNYKFVSNQFDSTSYFFTYWSVSGKDTTFDAPLARGQCYFLGIYTKKDFTYSFFRKHQNVNRCFDKGNYLWTYFNLLRNQWLQIDRL